MDCGACGIVFARYRPGEAERVVGDIELTGRVELINLWEAVTARYNDASLHEEFVRACYEAGCLPFASQKYARILVGAPEEEIARKMRKRIVGLASAKFERSGLDKTTWKVPLPSFNNFIILLGVILLFVGLGFPKSHDIAGVGIAMLALAVGLKYFTRRPA